METIAGLFLVLLVARLFAAAATRLRQPSVVGELLAGIVLAGVLVVAGGWLPGLTHFTHSTVLEHVVDLAMFFIVLLAGIEMKPSELGREASASIPVAIGGMVLPFALGFGFAWLLIAPSDLKFIQSFFVGVALSITAIPATVAVLQELGQLKTRMGETIVAAALFDDIFGLFLLALLTSLMTTGETPSGGEFLALLVQVAGFFAITLLLGAHVYPRISRHLHLLQLAEVEVTVLILVAAGYAVLAELLGLHWVMGAFVAGLFFEPERIGARGYNEIRLIMTGIVGGALAPIFFAATGMKVDLGSLLHAPGLIVGLIFIAVLGKLVGAGAPALLRGFSRREATAIGTGMSARGAVELVVISIAIENGLFANEGGDPVVASLASALILMAVATTLIAPALLRFLVDGPRGKGGKGVTPPPSGASSPGP